MDHNKIARVRQLLSTIQFLEKCLKEDKRQGGHREKYWNEQIYKAKRDLQKL